MDGCGHDEKPMKNFPIQLSQGGSLSFSLGRNSDTDSTSSTEVDSSFSRHSLSSEESLEICSTPPRNRRSIFRRAVRYEHGFDEEGDADDEGCCQEISLFDRDGLHNDDVTSSRQAKTQQQWKHQHFFRLAFKRYYALLALGICCSIGAILQSTTYTTNTTEFNSWTRFLEQDAARVTREIKKSPTPESFIIVLNGGRLDLIQQSLDAHVRCPSVEDIVINFDGMDHPPEYLLSHRTTDLEHVNSLDAQSLFLLNEGVMLSCDELEKAFAEWKRDRRRVVGFFGYRSIDSSSGSKKRSKYDTTMVPSGSGPYSMVSDRAMFIHRRYLEVLPTKPESSSSSCCHLLLSMQVVAASSRAPLVVRSKPRELLDGRTYTSNPAVSTHRLGQSVPNTDNECSNACVPKWLRPSDSTQLREEGNSILA